MGPLDRLLGPLGALLGTSFQEEHFLTEHRGHNDYLWPPRREPKSSQNGIQNESKVKTMFKMQKIDLQDRLGALLGPSWVAPISKNVLWLQRRSFLQR